MTKIIGQDHLVNEVSKIFKIFVSSECVLRPHFILTGESGSGKTFTIKTLCDEHKISYIEINAAQLTKEGTSGNSLSKALSPLRQYGKNPCVVFVDEFDKMFISGNSNGSLAHETTTGVQNEFLKVLESDYACVYDDYGKYINVPAKNALFIFSGAFNGEANIGIDRLRELGVKTEFLGRVGLVYNTNPLTLEHLYEILDNSTLFKTYLDLFADADREKITYEIKGFLQRNRELNTLGARLVNTLIHQYFIKGKLVEKEVKEVAFQTKLKLN